MQSSQDFGGFLTMGSLEDVTLEPGNLPFSWQMHENRSKLINDILDWQS